jgi:hypothetical protein
MFRLATTYEQFIREDVMGSEIQGHYLGKVHREREQLLAKTPGRPLSGNSVVEAFRHADWRGITFEVESPSGRNGTSIAYPKLPAKLQELVDGTDEGRFQYGSWYGGKGVRSYSAISMEYEAEKRFNRTHFSGGIPSSLQGIGLGVKLYRALLEHVGFMASEEDASPMARRAWLSLVTDRLDAKGAPTDQHVHSIAVGSAVLAISPSLPAAEKVEVATRFLERLRDAFEPGTQNFGIDPPLRTLLDEEDGRILAPFAHASARDRDDAAERHAVENLKEEIARICATDQDNHDWGLLSYVVVRSVLLDETAEDVPVYQVTNRDERTWHAERKGLPAIKTSDKTAWVLAKRPADASDDW